ncbi:MAG TPA: SDR family oxidoreductase [Herpetosiphonaceae bacterium]
MQDKLIMVTGATDGIGKETALGLARMGAHVIVVGRTPVKIAATVEQIKAESGNGQIDSMQADFSSLAQIRQLAKTFYQRYDHLDVLVNNAGGVFGSRSETADGFEWTFGVNHLAPFLLTNLLLPALQVAARRSGSARVVTVSSAAHMMSKLNFDDLQNQRRYSGFRAYAQSKLANLLFTYELARRLKGTGITANALHPGGVASNFGRGQPGLFSKLVGFAMSFGITPEQGAQTSIYMASSPEVAGVTGTYFNKQKPARSSPASHDAAAAAQLWQISEQLTGLAEKPQPLTSPAAAI